MNINISTDQEHETISSRSCETQLVNTYRYLTSKDFAEYFKAKGYSVAVERISDGTNSSPTKTMILGHYFNLAFYAKTYSNQYGYKADSTIICEVVYKNGDVAMPHNTYEFNIELMNDSEVSATIDQFIKFNKDKLSEWIIHHSANSPEMLERMENNGNRKAIEIDDSVSFEFEHEDEEF